VPTMPIETDLFHRQGRATSNFKRTLPRPQSDLADDTLKDPDVFDFLGIGEDAAERELHRGLVAHLRKFLLELGLGFAFVGSQVHLEVGGGADISGCFGRRLPPSGRFAYNPHDHSLDRKG
jgi:predicted nuclease of restriction endonuclease-like (RecB) superfamily